MTKWFDTNYHYLVPELAADQTFTPDAGDLAGIDGSAYGWGDDPATLLRHRAKVALHHGPEFGAPGAGYVRLNFGCSPELLTEAVERIAAFADSEWRA